MNIVIVDATMDQSWSFATTPEGYCAALAKISAIAYQGHRVGGDVAKAMAYGG